MKKIVALATLLGLSLAAPAFAQGAVDFDTLDANMDGAVSFEELQVALPAITQDDFTLLDTDGDALSREEFTALLEAPAAW